MMFKSQPVFGRVFHIRRKIEVQLAATDILYLEV